MKRAKTESRLNVDKNSGHWIAEIAKPLESSSLENLSPQDYQVTRIDLGKGSHGVDMKIFETSNKKIADRV